MATRAKSAGGTRGLARRRGRLAPGKAARGLDAADVALALDAAEVAELTALVRSAGGAPIGAYREPLGGRALLLAALPLAAVQPTPFQRDLSPTHAKRLAASIDATGAFLDPLIVVRGEDGGLWTPNGRHRLAAGPQRESKSGVPQVSIIEARGLARGYVGRGTFVSAAPDSSGAPFAWRGKVAAAALRTTDTVLRDLIGNASDPAPCFIVCTNRLV